ncbi:hypothetical protein GFC01_12080 [Desulfofundulus thermobenzoicus]|uniref:Bacterial spore germination immunoglobulin-like domain-containing protein n=1 Tax=Desulfofundulus thermobenzoicus TaxID=29376 RepID=A0A6N7IS71_9FIRM|nr:Gmad2 immunoglobulin-like domain-containing protein [Desulfofundulus thermobenzoicus]MQL52985.1 hypothetical protein [Desulfofundulus thermobenzoicus]
MRRLLLLMLAALFVTGSTGSCAVARKPAPPDQPRTVILPESTRVSFDRVDLNQAPDVVRDVARALENTDSSTWVQAGNDIYLLISQGPRTRDYRVEIGEITQRNPRADFSWLDVKGAYAKSGPGQAPAAGPLFTVARVGRLDRPVNGVAFQFTRRGETAAGTTGASPAAPAAPPTPPAARKPVPVEQGEAQINEPAPNREISSPVRVVGRARHPGEEVRVRLVDGDGRVMAEKALSVSRDRFTEFETSLSYSPPASPRPGFVEVLAVTREKETSLARVPVTIK